MTQAPSINFPILDNDEVLTAYSLSLTGSPTNGSAVLENDETVTYTPNPGFNNSLDTIYYKVCLESNAELCDSSYAVVLVELPVGVNSFKDGGVEVYPNPAGTFVIINLEPNSNNFIKRIQLNDLSGRMIFNKVQMGQPKSVRIENTGFNQGIYMLKIITADGIINRKLIFKP